MQITVHAAKLWVNRFSILTQIYVQYNLSLVATQGQKVAALHRRLLKAGENENIISVLGHIQTGC